MNNKLDLFRKLFEETGDFEMLLMPFESEIKYKNEIDKEYSLWALDIIKEKVINKHNVCKIENIATGIIAQEFKKKMSYNKTRNFISKWLDCSDTHVRNCFNAAKNFEAYIKENLTKNKDEATLSAFSLNYSVRYYIKIEDIIIQNIDKVPNECKDLVLSIKDKNDSVLMSFKEIIKYTKDR